MPRLDHIRAGILFLCCSFAGCGNPSPAPDAVANGTVAPLNRSAAAAPAAPAAANGSAAQAAAREEGSIGGSELSEDSANLDFILVNHTGQTITALSISPQGEESWTPDILVPRDLPTNERGAVSFSRDVEICSWDIRATYEGGHRRSWPHVDLCNTVRVELR